MIVKKIKINNADSFIARGFTKAIIKNAINMACQTFTTG